MALLRIWNFCLGSSGKSLLRSGWSEVDRFGPWTVGKFACLGLPMRPPIDGCFDRTIIRMEGYPYIPNNYGSQGLTVALNGVELSKKTLTAAGYTVLDFDVPEAALFSGENAFTLTVEHPAAPSEAGLSNDTRTIGFHLTRLSVFTAVLG